MSARGDIHTPWGKQTLPQRCATVKDDCHSPRAAASADLDAPSIAPPGDGGVSNCVGGAEVARRSHKPEVEGSNPSPATNPLRVGGLTVDPEALSERTLLFLKLVCAHHRCAPNEALERALSFYCNSEIGLQRCADLNGGEGV